MPSLQIHLAIAKRYMEKHEVADKEAFIEGSVAPDFVRPKEKSHYTREVPSNNLLEDLKNKVDLERYLKENVVKTDYDRGIFLHLLTDKIFFTEFFEEEVIKNYEYQEFSKDLYTSYNQTNRYLEGKYPIILKEELKEKIEREIEAAKKKQNVSANEGNNILPLDNLDAFIERMSDVNLEEYMTKE